jgi:phosphatidate phosphatase APP1
MPLIWQLSAAHFGTKTLLHGVLAQDMPPLFSTESSSIKNLLNLLKSYFITLFSHAEIIIEVNGRKIKSKTDKHGEFLVELDFLVNEHIKIYTKDGDHRIKAVQEYPVIFPELAGEYEVVSDIDDTIMVSYTADFFKRIITVALKGPYKRRTIDFTQHLFKALEKQQSRIFYISKSESNLFGMINTFLKYHQLPKGDIFLTPYLKFTQLFSQKKGKAYKEDRISFIIENSSKKIILIGDDSQKDMEAYATMFTKFPKRIFKIFIRQTKSSRSQNQIQKWQALKATGANIVYFNKKDCFDKNSLLQN